MKCLLVTVGTDHHPFDRLVRWADQYARDHQDVEVFVQYGSSPPPTFASGARLLDHAQLQADLRRADVVISHGGPATISEARRVGHRPICVPRDPRRGEHVDEHQMRFVAHLAKGGLVQQCREMPELTPAVDDALAAAELEPTAHAPSEELSPAVRRLGELLTPAPARPPSTSGSSPITVLYIGGQGRSGSTLLERAAGQLPGIVAVGEVVHLWLRGLRDNELCGCGQPFHSCEFWESVGQAAFDGWDTLDAQAAVDLRYAVDRNRYLPLLLRPSLSRSYHRRHAQYLDRLAALYRGIAEASGARVLVDSSKHASYALLLAQTPGIDLRVLHVVRDSRAVAHAWSRQVRRPEATNSLMPTYGPLKASALWDVQNVVIEGLQRRHPYLRIRYEDFVSAPKDTLLQVASFADPGETDPSLPFLDGDTIDLDVSHTVAGNPMRFTTGPVTVQKDERWQREMPTGSRRVVEALTVPLNRHYGYSGRPS